MVLKPDKSNITKIVVKDAKTSIDYIKTIYLPVPLYELGEVVAFKLPQYDTLFDGVITGFEIFARHDEKEDAVIYEILYNIDYDMYEIVESEVVCNYPNDKKEFDVLGT